MHNCFRESGGLLGALGQPTTKIGGGNKKKKKQKMKKKKKKTEKKISRNNKRKPKKLPKTRFVMPSDTGHIPCKLLHTHSQTQITHPYAHAYTHANNVHTWRHRSHPSQRTQQTANSKRQSAAPKPQITRR
jgi:hypothetical protein